MSDANVVELIDISLCQSVRPDPQQNDDGHLVIDPVDESRIIAFETRLAANFGCRLVLRCDADDTQFGIYDSSQKDQAVTVTLPSGINLIEIARQRGKWQCRLNGDPTEVSVPAEVPPTIAGYLGFNLPKDTACEVLAIEMRVK